MGQTLGLYLKKYWFFVGLVTVSLTTVLDCSGKVASLGTLCQAYGLQEIVIFAIFFLSGLGLETPEWQVGLKDLRAIIAALCMIFVISPGLALPVTLIDLPTGYWIGFVLVVIMPTTLSSGVVMTKASGGNAATALIITVLANFLAIFTVPPYLKAFLHVSNPDLTGVINTEALIKRMFYLVAFPIILGCLARTLARRLGIPKGWMNKTGVINSIFIIVMVWIAVSRSRDTFLVSAGNLAILSFLVGLYHSLNLACAFLLCRIMRIPPGRDIAVIFMGCQKTLTLAVLLQTTVFPQYGESLLICVLHHLIHLFIDGYLVGLLRDRQPAVNAAA
ncbi:bile acid:sodium symporter [Thermodesulforhabdus norvegica]|uniref:Solute carrier family 10 (Sodium/bile acid cotransporter), member 7 n=1 Tax=Thermodesulforhabdus norvegica TaxID=39841 RepID=A0A1I4V506_9BACT|nr:bile acid:sodium symporter [Thermodesulforhabdus norvegica]SFM96324.1 solute carrier family 10 (sodium/bile acid cotransporter), member 7 [Thermodesulforhabdus norvegica]